MLPDGVGPGPISAFKTSQGVPDILFDPQPLNIFLGLLGSLLEISRCVRAFSGCFRGFFQEPVPFFRDLDVELHRGQDAPCSRINFNFNFNFSRAK